MNLTKQTSNLKQLLAGGAVLLSRLHLLPANISPVGSFGFFGNSWLYAGSIVLFDLTIGGLYQGFWFTYLGFAAYPLLGKLAGKSWHKQVVLLPLASLAFFALSNLGVWWAWYDHNLTGLATCYSLALPFYQRTLIGDLLFGYSYVMVKHWGINFQTLGHLQVKNPLTQI